MIQKIETVYDLYVACRNLPEFLQNPLCDLKDLLDEEIHENGWYWDEEKKELFSPYIVLSEPGYDMVFIMKDSLHEDECFPTPQFVNWACGQTFYLDGHPDFSKEKLFDDYIFNANR